MNSTEKAALLALSEAGCTIYRNEVAGAWVGKTIHKAGDQVTLRPARMITTGLCKGSADLIGVTPVTITPQMIGKTVGVFTAVEVKAGRDRLRDDQAAFIDLMRSIGAIAGEARGSQQAARIIEQHLLELSRPQQQARSAQQCHPTATQAASSASTQKPSQNPSSASRRSE